MRTQRSYNFRYYIWLITVNTQTKGQYFFFEIQFSKFNGQILGSLLAVSVLLAVVSVCNKRYVSIPNSSNLRLLSILTDCLTVNIDRDITQTFSYARIRSLDFDFKTFKSRDDGIGHFRIWDDWDYDGWTKLHKCKPRYRSL